MDNKKEIVFYKKTAIYQRTDAPIIAIKFGESGYYPIYSQASVEALNYEDLTDDILESAEIGSMCGWGCPGAKLATDYAMKKLRNLDKHRLVISPNGDWWIVEPNDQVHITEVVLEDRHVDALRDGAFSHGVFLRMDENTTIRELDTILGLEEEGA